MKRNSLIILAAINLLLLFAAIFCMARTYGNNKRINDVSVEFSYTETEGKVILDLTSGKSATLKFGNYAVCVYDCYLFDFVDSAELLLFVKHYGKENGYNFSRDNTEMLGEFTLHKTAYNMKIRQEQSKNLDWDYGQDKRQIVNVLSKAIGFIGL